MRASSLLLLLAGLIGMTLAQTTVIQFLAVGQSDDSAIQILDTSSGPVSASVVDVNAVATTLSLNNCRGAICEALVTEGPSTFAYSAVINTTMEVAGTEFVATITAEAACQITASTSAVCTLSEHGAESYGGSSSAITSVEILTYSKHSIATFTVTATAGVSKLQQPQATQTPGAAPRPVIAQGAVAPFGVALAVAVAGIL